MTSQTQSVDRELDGDESLSRMRTLCHFVDGFASGDAAIRMAAESYRSKLEQQGCDGETILTFAATILLVIADHQLEQRQAALGRLPRRWGGVC